MLEFLLILQLVHIFYVDFDERIHRMRPIACSITYGGFFFTVSLILVFAIASLQINGISVFGNYVLPILVLTIAMVTVSMILIFWSQTLEFRRLEEIEKKSKVG
jgi:hypothetical protein